MGNVHNKPEQKRSRRRLTVSGSNIRPPSLKEPFLFITDPKVKSKDVQMHHIYGLTETMGKTKKTVAITDLYNSTDISSDKRYPTDGIV